MNSSISSLLMVLGLWLCMAFFCCGGNGTADKSLTEDDKRQMQAMKDNACKTVAKIQQAGAFTKIQPGFSGVTHAYVDRVFYSLPVDSKETALKGVALCNLNIEQKNQLGLVIIHDGYSGKRIGEYSLTTGLKLD